MSNISKADVCKKLQIRLLIDPAVRVTYAAEGLDKILNREAVSAENTCACWDCTNTGIRVVIKCFYSNHGLAYTRYKIGAPLARKLVNPLIGKVITNEC